MKNHPVNQTIQRGVTLALEGAGFAIRRTSESLVAWRKDLPKSHFVIYFGDRQLYGALREKRWTLMHVDDVPPGRSWTRQRLDLFFALASVRKHERVATRVSRPVLPVPTTNQTGNA